MSIRSILLPLRLWPFGKFCVKFGIFFLFWYIVTRKIWQPCSSPVPEEGQREAQRFEIESRVARFFFAQHTKMGKIIPNDHQLSKPNGRKIAQNAIKYTKVFHCRTRKIYPNGDFGLKMYHLAALVESQFAECELVERQNVEMSNFMHPQFVAQHFVALDILVKNENFDIFTFDNLTVDQKMRSNERHTM
jgi:hypothetical protein